MNKNDLIWVRGHFDEYWVKRYFSHYQNGKIYCAPNGIKVGILRLLVDWECYSIEEPKDYEEK